VRGVEAWFNLRGDCREIANPESRLNASYVSAIQLGVSARNRPSDLWQSDPLPAKTKKRFTNEIVYYEDVRDLRMKR